MERALLSSLPLLPSASSVGVALAQINPTVGALRANVAKILSFTEKAVRDGADLVVFPELALCGYPPEDLVLKPAFIEDCQRQLAVLERKLPPAAVVIVGAPIKAAGSIFNAAVVFHGGQQVATYYKRLLPNYGVFDEQRLFCPGHQPLVLSFGAVRVGVHICEDSWRQESASFTDLQEQGLAALINLSASPYHRGKLDLRKEVLQTAARRLSASVYYCNLVGGQDELVFDGGSMVLDPDGRLLASGPQFEEGIVYSELAEASVINGRAERIPPPSIAEPLAPLPEVYAALRLGLADYAEKNGFRRVVVALSGGIDSALVAALAVDALGKERVVGVTMPSVYSSPETYGDACLLAKNLGIEFLEVPIKRLMDVYLQQLTPLWPGRVPDLAEENLQARIRGNIVMALSNKFGWLVLTTGNKSELATGYCTLYGDMAGGFAVIKDVPKTLVFDLAKWRNSYEGPELIPATTISRPPTAELRANQKDSDSLPPYEILDQIIEAYVERDSPVAEMVALGLEKDVVERVVRLIDRNEYKRRQAPPGIKITPKAFGRDRRMPITNRSWDV